MEEALKQYIQSLSLTNEEKEYLLKEFKANEKKIETLDFKFKRTLVDKTAITNILNASIEEIAHQKKIIENTKDEINRNLIELDEQKKLIEEKNSELNKLLSNLKKTQKQLIMSEKMASLGELTAGIAHEIQNPLNFVNNFSEINKEMLEELQAERLRPEAERNKQTEDEIVNNVILNEKKILHHGKRADAIVKGMLQHSRQTKGIKEPTDINALCDEYLRLSFHGLRAKDKNFNADFKMDLDESISKINIVPQDIGRALLNLFNNAFYAVKPPNPLKGEQYKPLVSVTTRRVNSPSGVEVEIIVSDNGNGISQNVIDKIFQPFFTTKPTGQGTGLGLSLAYDIITKEHNGTIKVESKEGEGSKFILKIPLA
jgi:two-component system NtrC family sensor kinase